MEKRLIEAALFMSSRPLDLDELAKIAGIHSLGYVKDLLEKLKKDYEGRGIEVVNSPHGWEFQVRQELLSKVAHLTPYSDISEGSKRSLALIASREPLRQSELITIQGNKAYSYVKELEKRGLINSEKHGRSRILKLTQEFERYFGEEKGKIKKMLQEATDYQKQKIQDFIPDEKEVDKERNKSELKKVKTQKITKIERKAMPKDSADSGEIPW